MKTLPTSAGVRNFNIDLPNRKRVDTEGGWTTVLDGVHRLNVAVMVDFEAIAKDLAQRAFKNKRGIAKYMHGAITVTAVTR